MVKGERKQRMGQRGRERERERKRKRENETSYINFFSKDSPLLYQSYRFLEAKRGTKQKNGGKRKREWERGREKEKIKQAIINVYHKVRVF